MLLLLPSMACSVALGGIMPYEYMNVFSYRCLTRHVNVLRNDAGPCNRNMLHAARARALFSV